jgi:hypothetical protein
MDEMDLWVPLWCTASWVDMVPPEVPAEVQSFLDWQVCKVLVAEGWDLLGLDHVKRYGETHRQLCFWQQTTPAHPFPPS